MSAPKPSNPTDRFQLAAEPPLNDRAAAAGLFVGTLFPQPLDAYIERRWWRGQQISQRWDRCGDRLDWARLLPHLDTAHVFIGVAARRRPGDGGRGNCYALPAVFVDADLKTRDSADTFVAALEAFPLPPTMIVRSGSKFSLHAYWCLTEPHLVMSADGNIDPEKEQAYRRVQLGLAQHFKTDQAVCDLPRIMRLPGTKNCKPGNGPGAFVCLPRCRPERRYPLSAFDAWRAETESAPTEIKSRTWSDPTDPDAVDFLAEFGRRGWLLSDQGGGMFYVRCPWGDQHSPGNSSSTAIWLPDGPGWAAGFRCLHADCEHRRAREVYAYFRLMRAADAVRRVSA